MEDTQDLNERVQIKRKYADHGAYKVNNEAPIRNRVVEFVGKRFVTEEEMKNFLTKLEEDRGSAIDQRQWFGRNMRYFESFENRGNQVWTLSKFGKRVYEFIVKSKAQQQQKTVNESIGLFKSDFLNESIKRTPEQIIKSSEDSIKNQIAKYSELMKTHPENANIYKAQIDLAHARMSVIEMKKKLQAVKK